MDFGSISLCLSAHLPIMKSCFDTYSSCREYFGLSVPQTFDEVTGGLSCITDLLESLYGVDNVAACDPIICGFAEPATRGQQGELFFAQNMNQFRRLRDADRYVRSSKTSLGIGHQFHAFDYLSRLVLFASPVSVFIIAACAGLAVPGAFHSNNTDEQCISSVIF